jgi:hypothetical protein
MQPSCKLLAAVAFFIFIALGRTLMTDLVYLLFCSHCKRPIGAIGRLLGDMWRGYSESQKAVSLFFFGGKTKSHSTLGSTDSSFLEF